MPADEDRSGEAPDPSQRRSLERAARERLPNPVYQYFAGGAGELSTVRENRAAFRRARLRPRVLCDVSARDLTTTAVGRSLAMPIAIAPTALQRLAHPDGELATARAAASLGTAMVLATVASSAIEDVAAGAQGTLWFQTYVLKDRGATRALVERAERAGASALVLTVDAAVSGRARPGAVNRFVLPNEMRIPHLEALYPAGPTSSHAATRLSALFASLIDPSLGWKDIAWLRAVSDLPLVLKGILTGDDTRLAIEHGASAVIVSNHGGRVLDGAVGTLDALPDVARAADGRIEVWLDGGVRSGGDVVKALALGARLVLVGRPVLWGLAVRGEDGVRQVLTDLRDELDDTLALCGCRTPADVRPEHVVVRP
jgi:isopentenyl diphosphate isomerase/L-lactate dehydrogenase-like FMN-dependent dehydrogenase